MNNSFWKAGHAPTLFAAFLYFDLSFMVWYVLGPLGVQIAGDLQLSTQQRAMMVATPILAGAVLRFLLGLLADRWSPRAPASSPRSSSSPPSRPPGCWA